MNFDNVLYTLCKHCDHFVDPDLGTYIHLEDGKQEFNHNPEPSDQVHTGAEWQKLRPDLFQLHLDEAIGPNSLFHSQRGTIVPNDPSFVDSSERAKQDSNLTNLDYQLGVFRQYFTSPFDQYKERIGEKFTLMKRLPDAESNDDGPGEDMYLIRFEDGVEIEVWGHEVCVLNYDKCS